MSDDRRVAVGVLVEAAKVIGKERPGVHGSAENSFTMIAEMWSVYLRHAFKTRKSDDIRAEDVAEMMSLLKKGRKMYGDPTNRDNYVDDTGYTALAGMLTLPVPFDVNMQQQDKLAEDLERELDIDVAQPEEGE